MGFTIQIVEKVLVARGPQVDRESFQRSLGEGGVFITLLKETEHLV